MKKLIIGVFVCGTLGVFTSCERCATCTYNDPSLGRLEEEICDRGHRYNNTIDQYEDNNWACSAD